MLKYDGGWGGVELGEGVNEHTTINQLRTEFVSRRNKYVFAFYTCYRHLDGKENFEISFYGGLGSVHFTWSVP